MHTLINYFVYSYSPFVLFARYFVCAPFKLWLIVHILNHMPGFHLRTKEISFTNTSTKRTFPWLKLSPIMWLFNTLIQTCLEKTRKTNRPNKTQRLHFIRCVDGRKQEANYFLNLCVKKKKGTHTHCLMNKSNNFFTLAIAVWNCCPLSWMIAQGMHFNLFIWPFFTRMSQKRESLFGSN